MTVRRGGYARPKLLTFNNSIPPYGRTDRGRQISISNLEYLAHFVWHWHTDWLWIQLAIDKTVRRVLLLYCWGRWVEGTAKCAEEEPGDGWMINFQIRGRHLVQSRETSSFNHHRDHEEARDRELYRYHIRLLHLRQMVFVADLLRSIFYGTHRMVDFPIFFGCMVLSLCLSLLLLEIDCDLILPFENKVVSRLLQRDHSWRRNIWTEHRAPALISLIS